MSRSPVFVLIMALLAGFLVMCGGAESNKSLTPKTPEELAKEVIETLKNKDQAAFLNMMPSLEEVIEFYEAMLPDGKLKESQKEEAKEYCNTLIAKRRDTLTKSFEKALDSGAYWSAVTIIDIKAQSESIGGEMQSTTISLLCEHAGGELEMRLHDCPSNGKQIFLGDGLGVIVD